MPIKTHQKKLDAHFRKLGWHYWPPLVILARLTEEVGELARLVNHRWGMKKKKASEAEQDMEEEVGDILYTLACFANDNKLDLDRAFRKSFAKVASRDKHRFDKKK
jgi:NTP pyrophosphatase (non-canonical NTP hydrolase)